MTCGTSYPVGSTVTVSAAFANQSGPVDPPSVTLRYIDPSGAQMTVPMGSLTHTGPGAFSFFIAASSPGVWYYRFEGGGAVGESTFTVEPGQFAAAA